MFSNFSMETFPDLEPSCPASPGRLPKFCSAADIPTCYFELRLSFLSCTHWFMGGSGKVNRHFSKHYLGKLMGLVAGMGRPPRPKSQTLNSKSYALNSKSKNLNPPAGMGRCSTGWRFWILWMGTFRAPRWGSGGPSKRPEGMARSIFFFFIPRQPRVE